jgi:microcystin degradation protein MlrC
MTRPPTIRPLRIAIAGFLLESVTFIESLTTLDQFRAVESVGGEVIARHRGANTPAGGFISVCEREAAEIVPIFHTNGGAAGPATDAAYTHYRDRLLAGLTAAGRLDGVLLDLHGAMTTPTRTDADAETLELVRAAIGSDVPLIVALDYHANLDQRSIAPADAIFGYHFSPHTDMAETGERAARCLFAKLAGAIDPVCVIVKPGIMVPSIFSATGLEPLKGIVDRSIAEIVGSDRYLDISIFAGFSYADVPNCGFSIVVVVDSDVAFAETVAQRYAADLFQVRRALSHQELVHSVDTGIARAKALVEGGRRPVVLLEHADRMHDSTYLLRAMLDLQLPRTVIPYLWDPEAAAAAVAAGVGAKVRLPVGGHSSDRAGGPVTVEGTVIQAGPVRYRATGPYFTGRTVDLGPTALIRAGNVEVTVTSLPSTAVDDDCLTAFGRSIGDYDYIVLRSKTHFRAYFESRAAAILIIDTPDWGPADLTKLPYRHVRSDSVYPFAEGA